MANENAEAQLEALREAVSDFLEARGPVQPSRYDTAGKPIHTPEESAVLRLRRMIEQDL